MTRRLPRRFARSLVVLNAPVVAAFVIPVTAVVALNAGTTAAHAQILTPVSVQSAVVLDFDVVPGIDPVLGRKAADSVAVEMKSSGDFDVVPRQRVEELVATVPGLFAPYTPPTARRLGEAAGASVVITGRIVGATITRGLNNVRTARVQLEMRQMDARTGDFINGAQPSAITIDQFQELDDDVLMDQSLDKAAYDGVRQMRLYIPAEVTITSNLGNNVELNRGLRDGVRTGQRYSVLRDHYNPARRLVERIKIAEIRINNVDNFESNSIIVDGGSVGIRIGDKARRIYASGIPFTEPAAEPFSKRRRKRN
jgi:hypothetical protein